MIKKFAKDLKTEFKGYSAKAFSNDLMAGLTVAAVALPLALAFGVSSGATAASGLMTAIIAGCIIAAFGGAFYQISGPTGAMAAILISVVAQYGMQGVLVATALAGVLLILAGIFRLGRLTSYIPMSVITGFTSGIAVIIAFGQIDNFFGVTSQGTSLVEKIISYGQLGFSPDWLTLAIGVAVILLMIVYPKKWNSVIPSSLVGIILATAACMIFKLDVASVGEIPKSLLLEERLRFSGIDFATISGLISPAISIAALGMVESLLCGASAERMTRVRLDSDRELIAQGLGNLIVPFFGGIPATAAIARTSVAIKSGARTRLTGIIHAIVLLISMLALGPVMSRIPLSALAGVLIVTAWRMNEWETIRYIFKKKFKSAMFKFLVTMIATILLDLTVAILIGVVCALIFLVARMAKLGVTYTSSNDEEIEVCVTGSIIFANTRSVEAIFEKASQYKKVTFVLNAVPNIDISGVQALTELIDHIKEGGTQVYMCGLTESAMTMLKRSGLCDNLGEGAFLTSAN